MKNNSKWIPSGLLITVFLLAFITIKMDYNSLENNIVILKNQKRQIENNLKVLRSKEIQLLSKNRIEKIAIEELGMYSPSPESLVVIIE